MSRYDYGYRNAGATAGGYGPAGLGDEPPREPGSRRKKLAALAGSVYRAGAAAASELKEQYGNTRIRNVEPWESQRVTIPGSFPDVAIVTKGNEQMVLIPSYAKRHIKQSATLRPPQQVVARSASQVSMDDEEYWKQEWARMEDEKAVVDVDVRGWVYNPHTGPMTRRNRVLIGLARRLSGVPPPTVSNQQPTSFTSAHEEHERKREEEKIAKEARDIENKGQREKEAASKGTYSENPKEDSYGETDPVNLSRTRSGAETPLSGPSSPVLAARNSWAPTGELTEAELAVANANMMARLGPFLTIPLIGSPVTLFFYNDTQSQSRTVMTNDSGHFVTRVALDFVPTHVRVLAAESSLSVTEPVKVIENTGVSMISDLDDTVKRSNISMGAREIFRNTFVRDLADMTVDGVKEWYNSLYDMGVSMHYCSNSPWQLFPVIASFFKLAGLPPGSIHLKQYSGMLQGIFEPVAERKKGTLERILSDFPERKFLLVGDSGEADLEVYTELAVANPGRILAVFIRDVTTPEPVKFFEESFGPGGSRARMSKGQTSRPQPDQGNYASDEPADRPMLPPRPPSAPPRPEEDLIDLSEEPEELAPNESQKSAAFNDLARLKTSVSALDLRARKQPPPRPAKPAALRSIPPDSKAVRGDAPPLPSPRSRKPSGSASVAPPHPLTQMQSLSDQNVSATSTLPHRPSPSSSSTPGSSSSSKQAPPPPPPPRRKGTGASSLRNVSPRLRARRSTGNSDLDFEPLPGPTYQRSGSGTNSPPAAVSKKVDMWRRRLAHAHGTLDHIGVQLYTWRKGDDIIAEAEGIVKRELEELGRKRGR